MERIDHRVPGFALVAVVLTTLFSCGSAFEAERAEAVPELQSAVTPAVGGGTQGLTAIADVSERAVRSVVNISTTKKASAPRASPYSQDPFFQHFFRQHPRRQMPQERLERSRGSGVIVQTDGVVLTNNHVVDGADEVVVTLHDGREVEAEIAGTDPASDLAVLRLKDAPKDLQALGFGDSDALRLGEVVVAIGNPFGVGQTVTMGIVSAKGRANVGIVDYEDFIQTDAAINPGNSGGALLNLKGELVGINTAILSRSGGYQGIGFAVPSTMAQSIMSDLLDDGKVVRGFLGVMIQDLTPALARAMKVEGTAGVLISDVVDGSPADRAGLEPGDVVEKIDGRPVQSAAKLRNLVASVGAGRTVAIELKRNGDAKKIDVELEEKAGGQRASARGGDASEGIAVEPLSDMLRSRYEIDRRVEEGVVVTAVKPGSWAARAGLRPGDVILGIDQSQIEDPQDLADALKEADEEFLVRVHRRGGSLFVVAKR